MTKKVKNICVLLGLMSFMVFTVLGVYIFNSKKVNAQLIVDELSSEYFVGERISIPNAEFKISDTQSVGASYFVELPNGTKYIGSDIVLEDCGEYSVNYYAKYQGENLNENVKFNVYKHLFEVNGDGSAEYGPQENLLNKNGVKILSKENVIVSYGRRIDLSNQTKNDSLISFAITPTNKGFNDFEILNVKLIDANDRNTFVILKTACLFDRTYKTQCNSVAYINSFDYSYINDSQSETGLLSPVSFFGYNTANILLENYATNTLTYSYDYLNQVFYVKAGNGNFNTFLNLKALSNVWKGFSSNEVYMEIYADNVCGEYANFVVTDIAGHDISINKAVDLEKPEITLDLGDYTVETIPNAVVGKHYKIFDAYAFDKTDGIVDVNSFVYYNYYSDNKISLNIDKEGFIPSIAGTYTICYKALDKFKNVSVKTINIKAVNSSNEIEVNPTSGYENSATVGDLLVLPSVDYSGGVGNLTLSKSVKFGAEDVLINNNTFRALHFGEYQVKITATDYVGQVGEFGYSVQVSNTNKPVFVSDLEEMTQPHFIATYSYELPNPVVYVFNDNNTYSQIKATVSTDNGTISENKLTPTNVGNVTLTYSATANGQTSQVKITRPVYSIKTGTGTIDFKTMFLLGQNITSDYNANAYARYIVESDSSLKFVNKMLCDKAIISFSIEKDKGDFNNICFNFIDSVNPDISLPITFYNIDGSLFVRVDDGKPASIGVSLAEETKITLSLYTSNGYLTVNGTTIQIENFKGFESAFAWCNVVFNGVGANGVNFVVRNVGNQTFKSNIVNDSQKPYIVCSEEFGGNYGINQIYTIPNVYAQDIVSPELKNFTLSVNAPNGSPIMNKSINQNAEREQISFSLTSYGKYEIIFTATDYSNKTETFRYNIHVLDILPPTAQFIGEIISEVSSNTEVDIAQIQVSDNNSATEKITIDKFIKNPNGEISTVGDKFTPNIKGQYVIYYYVADENGNTTILNYKLTVKE